MKRIILTIIMLTITVSLFAQLSFRGGVDTFFVPFQYVEHPNGVSTIGMGMGRYDSNNQNIRARIIGALALEHIGFTMQLQFLGNRITDYADETPGTNGDTYLGFGENVFVWWQPFDLLRFDAGKFMNDDLRGKVNNYWTNNFTVGTANGCEIFTRFRARGWNNAFGTDRSDFGFLTSFKYDNYGVYFLLPGLYPSSRVFGNWFSPNGGGWIDGYPYEHGVHEVLDSNTGSNDFICVLERSQIAFSYRIPTKALLRIQYVGGNKTAISYTPGGMIEDQTTGIFNSTPRIEAAAQLLMIKGLNLDIGMKYHLPLKNSDVKAWDKNNGEWNKDAYTGLKTGILYKPISLSAGAVYTGISKLTLNGRIDTKFAGIYDDEISSDVKLPFEMNIHLWPYYDFGFAFVGIDFGFAYLGDKLKDGNIEGGIESGVRVGAGAFLEKRFGASRLRAGILFRAPGAYGGVKEDMVLSIPLIFDYTF